MGLISTIRKHSGLTVGIIASGLILLFIGGDRLIQLSPMLSGKHKTDVGEIAGQKITLQTYQTQVEQLRRHFPTSASVQETWLRDTAWRQLIAQISYQKVGDALGLMMSEDELVDMVQGEHIHPELQNTFKNPETKQFDRQQLDNYLRHIAQAPPAQQAHWHQFESELAALRQREKLTQLMVQSAYITGLEAQAQHDAAKTTLDVKCLYIPYHTRPDDAIKVTDAMLQDYLVAHKNTYQVEATRHIKYVTLPVIPSKEDEQAFQEELKTLKKSFSQATDDHAFAKINTDGKPSLTYCHVTSQQLPKALATQKEQLKKGMVIGPVQEGNVHKLYKVTTINPQAPKPYEIVVIEKQLAPGDQTRDQLFRKLDHCAKTIKDATQLEAYVAQEALQLHEAQVDKNDVQVGTLAQARELVQWLYREAVIGKVSPVFELENEYVVAVMTKRVPQGTAPLAQVRDEIILKVGNKHKACAIMTELQQLAATTLEEKVAQYGENAKLLTVKKLRFDDDTLQSAGMARQAVGAAFALQPGEQATVADDNGVLMIEVVDRHTEEAREDVVTLQKNLRQLSKIKQPYDILEGMTILAQIKDNRYRFY